MVQEVILVLIKKMRNFLELIKKDKEVKKVIVLDRKGKLEKVNLNNR